MALQNNSIMPIREYLSKTLYIPTYQREYSWEDDHLLDFWADLEKNKEDEVHFFGQIVVHNENDKKLYIIDGQQRTITSVIFLRALNKVYSENDLIKDTSDAKVIIGKIASLIGQKTRKNNDLHLVLGNEDKDYFISNIQDGYPDSEHKEKKKSQERMRTAFWFFVEKIEQQIKDISDQDDMLDILESFYDSFTNNFKLLYMEATKLNEAFIIFETLNERGKDLETADLLKNYLFSQVNDIKEAEKKWKEMVKGLDGIDPTKFIRHFWNSTYEFSREKELYKKITREIDTPKKVKQYLDNLEAFSIVYHDLSNPADCNYFSYQPLIESLIALKDMKAQSFYPVVLSLIEQNFSDSNIAEVVTAIENYVFRNISIAGKTANSSEVFFSKLAKQISDQVYISKDEIVKQIKEEMIDDDMFAAIFNQWEGGSSSAKKTIVRYIFRKIHDHLSQTSEVIIDNNKVHIEHIMPQDKKLWPHITEEAHEKYLWRLGNLALLDGSLNKEAQNKPFDEKRVFFKQSAIKPNEDIALVTSWGQNEIEDRQRQLTKYALEIW